MSTSQPRSLLATAVLRFGARTQSLKKTAIEKIVENVLSRASADTSMTVQQIQGLFANESGGCQLHPDDIRKALSRLSAQNRVHTTANGHKSYKLEPRVRNNIINSRRDSKLVIRDFIQDEIGYDRAEDCIECFLQTVSYLFALIEEDIVKVIQGSEEIGNIVDDISLPDVVKQVSCDNDLACSEMTSLIISFLQSSDPRINEIKWNLGQNFYIAKSMGFGDNNILSSSIFENAHIYLDTNVIISALEPEEDNHLTFKSIYDLSNHLNIEFKVTTQTLGELDRFLNYKYDEVKEALPYIPESTMPKVGGLWMDIYRAKQSTKSKADISDLFENFNDPENDLIEMYGVDVVDREWLNKEENKRETVQAIRTLQEASRERRNKNKRRNIALHDALLLRWIKKCRNDGTNAWVLTRDTSLPGVLHKSSQKRSLAITLDALLHWMSPVAGNTSNFKDIFSSAVAHRILPSERFFSIKDFRIFHELQLEVENLPAEDVEKCVRHIRSAAGDLDPSNPDDQLKLHYEVAKFFVDKDRKYIEELERLREETERLNREKKATREEYEEEIERTKDQYDQILTEKTEELSDDLEATKQTYQEEKKQWQKEKERLEKEKAQLKIKNLRKSARNKIYISLAAFSVILVLTAFAADAYGTGSNTWSRVLSAWVVYGGLLVFFVPITLMALKSEEWDALEWPFKNWLEK